MGTRGQQSVNTLIAMILGNLFAEWVDTSTAAALGINANAAELGVTLLAGGGLSYALEFLRAFALDVIPAESFPRVFKLLGGSLLALAIVACGTTPSDRYYSAVDTLSGVRETITRVCAAIPQPTRTEVCGPLRASFYVPSDMALEMAEDARQAVIFACQEPDAATCKDAGRKLTQATAGIASLSASGTRWLAARGVRP